MEKCSHHREEDKRGQGETGVDSAQQDAATAEQIEPLKQIIQSTNKENSQQPNHAMHARQTESKTRSDRNPQACRRDKKKEVPREEKKQSRNEPSRRDSDK
jgi:hypothetical protein